MSAWTAHHASGEWIEKTYGREARKPGRGVEQAWEQQRAEWERLARTLNGK